MSMLIALFLALFLAHSISSASIYYSSKVWEINGTVSNASTYLGGIEALCRCSI